MSRKLNIVIPMAGKGSRFADEGYTLPKPLIDVHGKPMIQVVVENLKPTRKHHFIFVCQQDHIERYQLKKLLGSLAEDITIIGLNGYTEGMACTVLEAKKFINNEEPLMTANSDQFIDFDINDYLNTMDKNQSDGLIMTMHANDPKWSFVKTDHFGSVTETAEKKVISNEATVGIYNFAKGCDFVSAAESMIKANERVNNEFYVCPCYNQLIRRNKKIVTFNIGSEGNGMYGLGIPSDLNYFLAHPVSKKIRG